VFGCGRSVTLLFVVGALGAAFNGLVYPALAYVLSHTFSNLSNAGSNGLDAMSQIAYSFLAVGGLALVAGLAQNWAFELVAYHASQNYRKQVRTHDVGADNPGIVYRSAVGRTLTYVSHFASCLVLRSTCGRCCGRTTPSLMCTTRAGSPARSRQTPTSTGGGSAESAPKGSKAPSPPRGDSCTPSYVPERLCASINYCILAPRCRF
jgi:hypothetical protein